MSDVPSGCLEALRVNDGFEKADFQDDGRIMADFKKADFHDPVCSSKVCRLMRNLEWRCDGAAIQNDGKRLRMWFVEADSDE